MQNKMFYNIFTSTAQLREVDGSETFLQMFCKCFILHVTANL